MAAIRATTTAAAFVREIFRPPPPSYSPLLSVRAAYRSIFFSPCFVGPFRLISSRSITNSPFRCDAAASNSGGDGGKKASARMSKVQQLMIEAEERALIGANEIIPRITLDQVSVSFARSGGPGGQNVNKVNTKVDMRFNVKNAYWLSERVREKILQMEKNRINKEGEIVISSTKTRTQKGNIEDALEKLQAIIDAASYVPPPPSEEQKKRVARIAAASEHKRLQNKKALSQKKTFRRNRSSGD